MQNKPEKNHIKWHNYSNTNSFPLHWLPSVAVNNWLPDENVPLTLDLTHSSQLNPLPSLIIQVSTQEEEQRQKPQESNAQSFFAITKSLIIRAVIIYFISSFFRRSAPSTQTGPPGAPAVAPNTAFNIFAEGTVFDLHIYLSESEVFRDFNDPKAKVWSEYELTYGDWYGGPNEDGTKTITYNFVPPKSLLNNGSIYLHVYAVKNGKSPDPSAGKQLYASDMMSYTKKMLNKFKKIKYQKTHNLLTGQTEASEEEIKVGSSVWFTGLGTGVEEYLKIR